MALIPVPTEPTSHTRPYEESTVPTLLLPAPVHREGTLEVGVLGPKGIAGEIECLRAPGTTVELVPGPIGTRIVLCYSE